MRQTARQRRRFGGHVRVLSPHGPLERLHLAQLECESEQEVACSECALQLFQRSALRDPDCRCAVRGQLLGLVAAARQSQQLRPPRDLLLRWRFHGLLRGSLLRRRRVACPLQAISERLPGQGLHPPGGQDAAAAGHRVAGRLPVLLVEHGRLVHTRLHNEAVDSVRDGMLLERPPWRPSCVVAR